MKTLSFLSTLLALICLSACTGKGGKVSIGAGAVSGGPSSTTTQVEGGTDIGSGGNGLAADWKNIAERIVDNLNKLNSAEIDLTLLKKIKAQFPSLVQKATVEFRDYPLILGSETDNLDNSDKQEFTDVTKCPPTLAGAPSDNERDAINFPSVVKIKVSRPRFGCYDKTSESAMRLVLHEYLGLLGISETEDGKNTNYQITNSLIAAFKTIQKFDDGLETVWIKTCSDLQNIGSDDLVFASSNPVLKTWKLANDIDCSETVNWNDGQGFRPRVLTGNLDGDGHSISNLHIATSRTLKELVKNTKPKSDDWHQAEFSEPNAFPLKASLGMNGASIFAADCDHCTIGNLVIENADVQGSAILIFQQNGTVNNVKISGRVDGETMQPYPYNFHAFQNIGGMAAINTGTISNSVVDVALKAPKYIYDLELQPLDNPTLGGLVAENYTGNIHHCKVRATISGSSSIGGIAGINRSANISNVTAAVVLNVGSNNSLTNHSITTEEGVGGVSGFNSGVISAVTVDGQIRLSNDGGQLGNIGKLVGENAEITHEQNEFGLINSKILESKAGVSFCSISSGDVKVLSLDEVVGWHFTDAEMHRSMPSVKIFKLDSCREN